MFVGCGSSVGFAYPGLNYVPAAEWARWVGSRRSTLETAEEKSDIPFMALPGMEQTVPNAGLRIKAALGCIKTMIRRSHFGVVEENELARSSNARR